MSYHLLEVSPTNSSQSDSLNKPHNSCKTNRLMLQLGIMRLQKYMQIERVPDGRIDMKYVIYRLEEINKSEESPYIKTVLQVLPELE